jgi:hypothetical protein
LARRHHAVEGGPMASSTGESGSSTNAKPKVDQDPAVGQEGDNGRQQRERFLSGGEAWR